MQTIGITAPPGDTAKPPESTVSDAGSEGVVKAGPPAEKPGDQTPPAVKPPAGEQTPTPKAGESFVPKIDAPAAPTDKSKQLDLSAAVAEFGKDGKVSDKTYTAAEAAGLSRADVDTFIAGHKARVDGVVTALSEIAGSQDNLKAIMAWASTNTDEATRNAFNAAMERADTPTAALMVRGLLSQYNDAVGVEGERIIGQGTKGGVQPFGSWQEVQKAMSDTRYKKGDPAYIASVETRMKVSNF